MKKEIELNSEAIRLRTKFGEDLSSPIDIFAIINNLDNLTLVFYPMSGKISGLCIRVDEEESLIAINSNSTYGRQRFTAAHELYHLYVQSDFKNVICGIDIGNAKDEEEKNADVFASFLLAPYDALKLFVIKTLHKEEKKSIILTNVVDIIKIEQYFGMSRLATLYRLMKEGYISADFANTLKVDVKLSARKLGYADTLYTRGSQEKLTTGSYIELTERLKNKDNISQGKYEELLLEAYRSDIVYNLNNENERYD